MKAKSANKEAASRIAQFRCLDDTTGGERGNERLKDVPHDVEMGGEGIPNVVEVEVDCRWSETFGKGFDVECMLGGELRECQLGFGGGRFLST
jgi:hypothetical protein